jgi:hypothetical protein
MQLTSEQVGHFHERGFAVIRGFFTGTHFLDEIRAEIAALGRVHAPDFDLATAVNYIRAFSPHARKYFYNGLRHLTTLSRMGASEHLNAVSRSLGLKLPSLMNASNIRMDMPSETEFLFHWHQDVVYTLGSLNAVTYWIPFSRVDRTVGSVEVLPASHRNGVHPVRYTKDGPPSPSTLMSPKDLRLIREPDQSGEIIEADAGDLVVFSTFILHRSVANGGSQVRWTAQLRHADLAETGFMAAGYPWGDMTNVFHAPYLLQTMRGPNADGAPV